MQWTGKQAWALVAVGAAAVAAGAWFGLVRGDDVDDDAPARRASAPDVSEALDFVPGCRIDTCRILARRGGFRFEGRDAVLAVVATPDSPEACAGQPRVGVHLLAADRVLWSGNGPVLCGDPLGGVRTDVVGHLFLAFPHFDDREGALVLRLENDAVEDFGSLDGRFSGGEVRVADLDDDGLNEVRVDGVTWRWSGDGYRQVRDRS